MQIRRKYNKQTPTSHTFDARMMSWTSGKHFESSKNRLLVLKINQE